jgi:hypothetical protein
MSLMKVIVYLVICDKVLLYLAVVIFFYLIKVFVMNEIVF